MLFLRNKFHALTALAVLALAISFVACVKTEFDEPPAGGDPVNITANKTIQELKALHVSPGGFDRIGEDIIISGEVVMDDRSGNYYKTLVIQDASGGIEVKFNDGYLYNQMPIGRQIYIRCKGLILTDYNGLTQLIGSTVEEGGILNDVGLTEAQVRTNVVKGAYLSSPVAPKVRTIAELTPDDVSTYVRIEDAQFIKADTGKTWADAVTQYSLNRTIEVCGGQKLLVRTSGFADFASQLTPGGKGPIEGVLGVFNGDYQLFLRNAGAASAMSGARCGGGIIGGGTPVNSIDEPFDGITKDADVFLNGWVNVGVVGDRLWRGQTFQTEKFVQATAYQSNLTDMQTWLITPPIILTSAKTLTFRSAWQVWKHDGMSVWISYDFDGVNVAAATWQPLSATIAKQSDGQFTWVNSGNVTLNAAPGGKAFIGFKYVGNSTANTTTWRLDDVKVF